MKSAEVGTATPSLSMKNMQKTGWSASLFFVYPLMEHLVGHGNVLEVFCFNEP